MPCRGYNDGIVWCCGQCCPELESEKLMKYLEADNDWEILLPAATSPRSLRMMGFLLFFLLLSSAWGDQESPRGGDNPRAAEGAEDAPTSVQITHPQIVRAGDVVQLRCVSDGHPPVRFFRWQKECPSDSMSLCPGLSQCSVSAAVEDAACNYICSARNSVGVKDSDPIRLNIQYGPRNVEIISVDTVTEGTEITLTCRSEAYPKVNRYSWRKMCNGKRTRLQRYSSSVQIQMTRDDASCSYICTARNSVSFGDSKPKHINIQYAPRDVTVVRFGPQRDVKDGDRVTLTCNSRSNPEAVYTWFKDNVNRAAHKGTGKVLTIRSISPTHSGDYYCKAENQFGNSTSNSFRIEVLYGPRNVEVFSVDTVTERTEITLTCRSEANPRPKSYSWSKMCNGQRADLEWNTASVRIVTTRDDSSCSYICTARNSVSSGDSKPKHINIQYAPTSVQITHPQIVRAGDVVQLRCVSDGHPPVRFFRWQKECPSDSMSLCPGLSQCSVSAAVEDAACNYICSARNSVGVKDSDPVRLNIQYVPRDFKIWKSVNGDSKRDLTAVNEGDTVNISCISQKSDPAVSGYSWYSHSQNKRVDGNILLFESISKPESGDYQCEARNNIGAGNSETITIRVQYAPTSVQITHPQIVRAGDVVQLRCVSDGHPPVRFFRWQKECPSDSMSLCPGLSQCSVSAAVEDAACNYICSARNSVGVKDSDPVRLNIQYVPRDFKIWKSVNGDSKRDLTAVNEGDTVNISCISQKSDPAVSGYSWYSHSQNKRVDGNILLFESISKPESGDYQCEARNNFGAGNSETITIRVQYAPTSVQITHPQIVRAGDVVQLRCVSDGHPPARFFRWQKECPSDSMSLCPGLSQCSVSAAVEDAACNYICSARNSVGVKDSDPVRMNIQYVPRDFKIWKSVNGDSKRDLTAVNEGDTVNISCISQKSDPAVSGYSWYSHSQNKRIDGNILLFESISKPESGDYQCEARNNFGAGNSETITIRVQYAPTSVQITHPQIVRAGDVVQLRCVSDGHPPVRFFRWQKECPSDSMSLCPGLSQCSVSAAVEDAACNYICSARNSVGVKDSDPVRLNIQYAPRDVTVVHTEPQREVKDGDRVSLNCNSRSNPEAVYTWFKDNVN
ncbi:hemicentin-2-like, partial [Stegostoma tigrinum]|uniref:hemicentin-2-like n=1 Tax=Stegostoma tigrinum TaxID=3053191 RepID=UPI00287008C3